MVAGAAGAVIVAPNMTQVIGAYLKHMDKKDARRTLHYMKYRKLIEVRTRNGQEEYRLTDAGMQKYRKIVLSDLTVSTPYRWDHKWRMVIFDIPRYKQVQRDEMLTQLKRLGFYMLQRSVWVHPFECAEQVGVLLHMLDLESEVSFMLVEQGNFTAHAEEFYKKRGLLI